jgi:hypothetical protein
MRTAADAACWCIRPSSLKEGLFLYFFSPQQSLGGTQRLLYYLGSDKRLFGGCNRMGILNMLGHDQRYQELSWD